MITFAIDIFALNVIIIALWVIITVHCQLSTLHYLRLVDNRIRASLLQCLNSKLVSIKRFAFQSEEDTTLRTITAIGGDAGVLLVKFIKFLYIHIVANFGCKDSVN